MMKRMIALVLAVVLCLGVMGVLAGCQQQSASLGAPAPKVEFAEGALDGTNLKFDETYTIEIWAPDNTDMEMEGSFVDKSIESAVNAKLNITEYESRDQYETLIAQDKIPALTFANSKIHGYKYGPLGAYIDWMDYVDQMPNVKKVLFDSGLYEEEIKEFSEDDGSMYQLPCPMTGFAEVTGFLYRKDIFEKHNLTFPTTQEEFYNTLKKLKEIYPNSYPFVMRGLNGANMGGLTNLANLFNGEYTGFASYNTLYRLDPETDTYYLAQTSDNMRECLQWLNKLYEEGLMHPSFIKMDNATWTEYLAGTTSFITYDKMDRIQMLTMGAIDANPDYELAGAAPFPMGTNGDGTYGKMSSYYSWLVSGRMSEEDLQKVLQYVDWMFSDKGIELTNWGVEGVSFEVDAEGNKKFIQSFLDTQYDGSGLGIMGMCAYKDFDVYCKSQTETVVNSIKEVEKYAVETNKGVRLTYTDDEQKIFDKYFQTTYDLCQAAFQQFINGERDPYSDADWNAYIKEIEDSIPAQMMEIHNAALARYRQKHPKES